MWVDDSHSGPRMADLRERESERKRKKNGFSLLPFPLPSLSLSSFIFFFGCATPWKPKKPKQQQQLRPSSPLVVIIACPQAPKLLEHPSRRRADDRVRLPLSSLWFEQNQPAETEAAIGVA